MHVKFLNLNFLVPTPLKVLSAWDILYYPLCIIEKDETHRTLEFLKKLISYVNMNKLLQKCCFVTYFTEILVTI